jgi:hypothetical protein
MDSQFIMVIVNLVGQLWLSQFQINAAQCGNW